MASTRTTAAPAAPAGSASATWSTYQHDAARTGRDAERIGAVVHRRWAANLDGPVYAQPLIVGDAVVVATESDSLYRLDAATGAVRWRTSMGQPVSGGQLPCGNVDPVGITGTPVVDSAAGLVWVAAFVAPGRTDLAAVDLATGAVRSRRTVDPPGADPRVHNQRAALALANGQVYVAFGGRYGDCGAYHGWVVSTPVAGGAGHSWEVPAGREGGIWAPAGPAVVTGGDLLVATGNTASRSAYDGGNSVVRLSPDLVRLDSFAPADWASLNGEDGDLGSTGPTPVSDGEVFQIGKTGIGYLLAGGHLGGIGGQLSSLGVCSAAFGANAWAPPVLYVPCTDGLVAVRVIGARLSLAWRAGSGQVGPPVVTAGVVWTVAAGSDVLLGLDPGTGQVLSRTPVAAPPHFAPLAAGDGELVVASGDGVLGLAP